MSMFSGGVNHPDHQIHTNNYNNNNSSSSSSSSSSSYAFDGASCFFHPINHHRLINSQVLQQQGYENFNHNSCFTTTPPPPHHNQAAASAACGLAGISSSSSSDPHPSCNHNLNYNHRMDDIHQEDESRTETDSTTVNEELGTAAVAGTSTSKDIDHIQIMHDVDDEDDDHHRHKKKDIQEEEGGWLRLSIGSCSHRVVDQINDQAAAGLEQQVLPRRRRRRSITWGDIDEEEEDHHNHHQFLELDLLSPGQLGGLTDPAVNPQPPISIRRRSSSTLSLAPPNSSAEPEPDHLQDYFPPAVASSSSSISAVMTTNSSSPNNLFLQQQYHKPGLMGTSSYYSNFALPISSPPQFQDPRALKSTSSENNIVINPTNYNSNINVKSSSLMPPAHVFSSSSYFNNRSPSFQLLHGHGHGHGFISATSPTFGFRVVDPPRRPHSGVWFMLQAALIQSKEPFLPQIPKSYLRTKDGRMTVQFIIKYLVDKLRLDSEAEIEIRCRGQQLVPFLTLQHVRDSIWMVSPSSTSAGRSPMDTTQPTSTSDHLMVLHYGRLS